MATRALLSQMASNVPTRDTDNLNTSPTKSFKLRSVAEYTVKSVIAVDQNISEVRLHSKDVLFGTKKDTCVHVL